MSEIKKGDTVRLKSGGPVMTVEDVYHHSNTPRASCVWFDGNKPIQQAFEVSSLVVDDGIPVIA